MADQIKILAAQAQQIRENEATLRRQKLQMTDNERCLAEQRFQLQNLAKAPEEPEKGKRQHEVPKDTSAPSMMILVLVSRRS